MSQETSVILRSILMHAYTLETKAEITAAVESLCTKEDISVVKEQLQKIKEDRQRRISEN